MKLNVLLVGVLSLVFTVGCSKDGGGGGNGAQPAVQTAAVQSQLTKNAWCVEYTDNNDINIQDRLEFRESGIVRVSKYEIGYADNNRIRALSRTEKSWDMIGNTLTETKSDGSMKSGTVTYANGQASPLNIVWSQNGNFQNTQVVGVQSVNKGINYHSCL